MRNLADQSCGLDIVDPKVTLTLAGSLSVLSYAVIFLLFYYIKIPNLRRHPTTINIHKCWFELLFVSQFLWLAFPSENFFWTEVHDDDSTGCSNQDVNHNLWPLSWLTQFSLLGSELWFTILSLDIHSSLTNPFVSYATNANLYTGFVYGVSILTATILVIITPTQYGLSTEPMIWINSSSEGTANWTKFFLFYIFMFFIYFYSIMIAYWARSQIYKGLQETLAARKYSISKQTKYVIGYALFWSIVFILQFINYLEGGYNRNLKTVSIFVLAGRGMWTLGLFLFANWKEINSFLIKSYRSRSNSTADDTDVPEAELETVQLNVALQLEIVRFTVKGIKKAVSDVDNTDQRMDSIRSSFKLSANKPRGSSAKDKMLENLTFLISDSDKLFDLENISDSTNTSFTKSNTLGSIGDIQLSSSQKLSQITNPLNDDFEPEIRTERVSSINSSSKKLVNFTFENEEMIRQSSVSKPENRHTSSKDSTYQLNEPGHPFSIASIIGNTINRMQNAHKQKNSFMFTDFCPKEFAKIREISNISQESYLNSFKSTTMPSFSEGRSGAFLYFTSDRKYIVKTTTESEFNKLLSIIPEYVDYFETETNSGNQSFITRFLGAHKIVMYDIPLHFVIMKNCCPNVTERYDLKGSWIGRHGSKFEYNPKIARPKKFSIAVKEGDHYRRKLLDNKGKGAQLFLDSDLQNCFLINPEVGKSISDQILRDIKFLSSFNLMDYSLLVGVSRRNFEIVGDNKDAKVSQSNEDGYNAIIVEGQGTFYVGIIDILQEWNYAKWYERMFKVYILGKDPYGISAIEPITYRKRFYQRAVLDVFDGLDAKDADPIDLFDIEALNLIESTSKNVQKSSLPAFVDHENPPSSRSKSSLSPPSSLSSDQKMSTIDNEKHKEIDNVEKGFYVTPLKI